MKLSKKQILTIIEIALAVVLFIMLFVDCVKIEMSVFGSTNSEGISGFDAWLGAENSEARTFGGVMTLVFIILLVVAPALKLFVKNAKIATYINYAILGLSVLTALFMFLGTTGLMLDAEGVSLGGVASVDFKLGIGAVIGGIVAIVNACACAYETVVLKK